MKSKEIFSPYNIAVFTLVFMSIQFVVFEGAPISMPKVVFMALTPIILCWKCPYISKAVVCSLLYWSVTVIISVLQFGTPKMSTFYYSILFLSTFCMYYNFVNYNQVFTPYSFVKIIKFVIYAYFIVIVLQQLFMMVGIRSFGLLNLYGANYYGIMRLNSLAIEPSHAARLLTIYFYAYIKMLEYESGEKTRIKTLFDRAHRKVTISYLYTMLALGSGTAFVAMGILSLYFMRRLAAIWVIGVVFLVYNFAPLIDFEPLTRAVNTFDAALTMDTSEVKRVDNSASSRVNILIETVNNLDLTSSETWFGAGVDSYRPMVQAIGDYGLISYILKLILFFTCCFTSFFSLETLMFILLFSLNIGNIAYGWAALMVFTTLRYFYQIKKYEQRNLYFDRYPYL